MSPRLFLLSTALPIAMAFSTAALAGEVKAVASFTVLADVVKQVGGKHVTVTAWSKPDGDPHEFEPRLRMRKSLNAADVVFVSGLGLEGWMDRLISASGYKGTPVDVSQGIKTREMDEDGKTVTDPHVWNSPVNVKVWVKNIETTLAAADPADKDDFKANAAAYLQSSMNWIDTRTRSSIPSHRIAVRSSQAMMPSVISAVSTTSRSSRRSAFRRKRKPLPATWQS